jgi:dienelactone hydrolase
VIAWYPAIPGTGATAEYVPGYDLIRDGLTASGELPAPVVAGLPFVGTHARANAAVASADGRYPIVVLSPGNATNVAFYAALAEDLASRGYVVFGVDHPYQVAAVDVGDGRVAVYEGDTALGDGSAVAARIDERVADLSFLLDRLAVDGIGLESLVEHLDLSRIGIVGHSNGGIAAVGICADSRVAACANIDGQLAGGPFSARPDPTAPDKPFLFLTKEERLHPALAAVFEAAGRDTFRVVVPAATHESFTDGPRFAPRFLPIQSAADDVLTVERGVVGAFIDRYLRGADESVFRSIPAPSDIYVEVYPLRGRPNLPLN